MIGCCNLDKHVAAFERKHLFCHFLKKFYFLKKINANKYDAKLYIKQIQKIMIQINLDKARNHTRFQA